MDYLEKVLHNKILLNFSQFFWEEWVTFPLLFLKHSSPKLEFSFRQIWIAPFWFFKYLSDDSLVQTVKKYVFWWILYHASICFSAWKDAQSQPELLLVFKEWKVFLFAWFVKGVSIMVVLQYFNSLKLYRDLETAGTEIEITL